MMKNVKDFLMSVLSFLNGKKRVLFEIGVGGFITVSVCMYFQSCVSTLDAEKFHYNGAVGRPASSVSTVSPVVTYICDSIR